MNKESLLNPSLKANVQDSLHFLMEINRQIEDLKSGSITQEEFAAYMQKRSQEWGYIANPKHTFKIIEQVQAL